GLMAESGYELSLVAGIATGALVKGGSQSEVPAQKLARSRDVEFDEDQTLKDVEKTEKETIPQHNDDPIVGSLFLNETLIYCQLCGI
ncbi:hypothetical protein Tco_0473733, partial [Tanacetum coccineum]